MLHKHNNNKLQNQRSQRASYQTQASSIWAAVVNSEPQHHNRIKVIHSDKASNRTNSKQDINRIKDSEISNKWAMANNKTNTNSMEPNNKCTDSSKTTRIMVKVNSVLNNNQAIILVALTIIKIRIISERNSSNSLGSTITIINSSSNSQDLIISNSNSPLSNKTATKVRHLICFECPIDLFNLKGK